MSNTMCVLITISGPYQLLGMVVSFLSVCYTSLNLFFSARVGEEMDDDPGWMFKLCIAPFVFVDLLCSVVLVSFTVVLTRGYGQCLAMFAIISANLLIQHRKGYLEKFRKDLDEQELKEKEDLKKGVYKVLLLSATTSWMINTITVKNREKVHLYSFAIAVFIYTSIISGAVVYQKHIERSTLHEYSILVCFPHQLTLDEQKHVTKIFYGTTPAVVISTKHVVRTCNEGEQSVDVIQNIIVPMLCVTVFLKLVTDLTLFVLSYYNYLVKFIECFGGNTIHHVHAIDAALKEKEYSNRIVKVLFSKVALANKQHPLTGKTIMHIAETFMSTDEIIWLYSNGANVDIRDFRGLTPKDCWTKETNEKLQVYLETREPPTASLKQGDRLNSLIQCFNGGHHTLFSIFLVLGSQPDAKNSSGKSFKDLLVAKLLVNIDQNNLLKYLNYLRYDDAFEIVAQTLVNLGNRDLAIKFLTLVFDGEEHNNSKSKFLHKLRSKNVSPEILTFFNPMPVQIENDLIIRILSLYCQSEDKGYHLWTPLHEACFRGKTKLAKLLLESGAHPNCKEDNGRTPLHWACHLGIVKHFIIIQSFL